MCEYRGRLGRPVQTKQQQFVAERMMVMVASWLAMSWPELIDCLAEANRECALIDRLKAKGRRKLTSQDADLCRLDIGPKPES